MSTTPETPNEQSAEPLPQATGSALLDAALSCLQTNGGPIDGADTIDGEEYVLVRMDAFKALEAAVNAPNDQALPRGGATDYGQTH